MPQRGAILFKLQDKTKKGYAPFVPPARNWPARQIPPVITSPAAANVNELATLAHLMTADQAVTWNLVGGVDQAHFERLENTLRWLADGTKDFEVPDDAGLNNTYIVDVRATSTASGLTTDQTITITVLNLAPNAATNWSPAGTPSIPATHPANTLVKILDKNSLVSVDFPTKLTLLADDGGRFVLSDIATGTDTFPWEIWTTGVALVAGARTITVRDQTFGGDWKDDVLNITVTGGPYKYKGNRTSAQLYLGTRTEAQLNVGAEDLWP